MKIDTLAFVQHLLASQHPSAVFHPHAPILLPVIISAVGDPFYKISSEALLVLESLVLVSLLLLSIVAFAVLVIVGLDLVLVDGPACS